MAGRMVWDGQKKKWVQSAAAQASQWKPGGVANPHGGDSRSNAQHQLNARKASALRAELLDALESKIMSAKLSTLPAEGEIVPEGGMPREAAQKIAGMLSADINRMLADAEDRGWGKPTQPTRDDSPPKKDIHNDMSPQEAAEAYQNEISGRKK